MKPALFALVMLLATAAVAQSSTVVNQAVSRQIDLTNHLATVTSTVTVKNTGSAAATAYAIKTDPKITGTLAFTSAQVCVRVGGFFLILEKVKSSSGSQSGGRTVREGGNPSRTVWRPAAWFGSHSCDAFVAFFFYSRRSMKNCGVAAEPLRSRCAIMHSHHYPCLLVDNPGDFVKPGILNSLTNRCSLPPHPPPPPYLQINNGDVTPVNGDSVAINLKANEQATIEIVQVYIHAQKPFPEE